MQEIERGSGFALPVDLENKATELRVFSFAGPHMRAFHLAWLSLFSCFFSTFAAPPLLPVLRATLGLTPSDVAAAGVASVSGAIISRLAMGPACDLVGPRRALAAASLLTSGPAIVAAAAGFVLLRFLSGLSISNFVANQYWMSSMFSSRVVGLANALSAGWANMGSAAAQLLMPLAYSLFLRLGAAPLPPAASPYSSRPRSRSPQAWPCWPSPRISRWKARSCRDWIKRIGIRTSGGCSAVVSGTTEGGYWE